MALLDPIPPTAPANETSDQIQLNLPLTVQGDTSTLTVGTSMQPIYTIGGTSQPVAYITGTGSSSIGWTAGSGTITVTDYTGPFQKLIPDPIKWVWAQQHDRTGAPDRCLSIRFEKDGIVVYEQDSWGTYHKRCTLPYDKMEAITVQQGNQLLTPEEAGKLERLGDLREAQVSFLEASETAKKEKLRADALAAENEALMKELAALKKSIEEHNKFLDRFTIED